MLSTGDYKKNLEIKRTSLGTNHSEVALSLNNLGRMYCMMGDSTSAEPLLREAIKIYQLTTGNKTPELALSFTNLAHLYKAVGKYADAELFYKKALKIRRETLGELHPDFATSLSSLGDLYSNPNRPAGSVTTAAADVCPLKNGGSLSFNSISASASSESLIEPFNPESRS